MISKLLSLIDLAPIGGHHGPNVSKTLPRQQEIVHADDIGVYFIEVFGAHALEYKSCVAECSLRRNEGPGLDRTKRLVGTTEIRDKIAKLT